MSYFRATPTKRLRTEPYSSSTPKPASPDTIDRTEPRTYRTNAAGGISARQAQIIEQQAEAENRAKQEQYDMETGTEAGIAPEEVARIVTPEAVQYANGDEVITAEGYKGASQGSKAAVTSYSWIPDNSSLHRPMRSPRNPRHHHRPKRPPPSHLRSTMKPRIPTRRTMNDRPATRRGDSGSRRRAGCTTNHTTYARRSGRCRTTANVFGRLAVFTAARHGNGSR